MGIPPENYFSMRNEGNRATTSTFSKINWDLAV
jgi:hypothetical protein